MLDIGLELEEKLRKCANTSANEGQSSPQVIFNRTRDAVYTLARESDVGFVDTDKLARKVYTFAVLKGREKAEHYDWNQSDRAAMLLRKDLFPLVEEMISKEGLWPGGPDKAASTASGISKNAVAVIVRELAVKRALRFVNS